LFHFSSELRDLHLVSMFSVEPGVWLVATDTSAKLTFNIYSLLL